MAEATQGAWPWRRVAYGLIIVGVPLLLSLIAISPIPMRGASMFGGIANAVKGHPRATAYLTLAAGAVLWLVIGGMVAVQEWRGERRKTTTG